MKKKLSKLKAGRSLVSIRREEIDGNRIQGFILGHSKELVLINYVYDFNLDGLMVLRLSDITDICSDNTDIFQTQILKEDGLYSKVDFNKSYDISDWKSVFSSVANEHRFIIAEDEIPENIDSPTFVLGEVVKTGRKSVSIHGFTGTARW